MALTKATNSMIYSASVYVDDYIPPGTDISTTNCAPFIQAAMDSTGGPVTVVFGQGKEYRINTPIYFKYGRQTLQGRGAVLQSYGVAAIDSQYESGVIYPAYTQIHDMTVVVKTAGSSGVNFHAQYGFCSNVYVYLQNNNQTGWNLLESQTGVTMVYYSQWINCGVVGTVGSGGSNQTGWYFQQISQYGPNTNTIMNGNNTGLSLGMSVRGGGNNISGVCIQGTNTCVLVSNLTGVDGVGCSANNITGLYLEGDTGATGVEITGQASDTVVLFGFTTGFSGGNLFVDNGIRTVKLQIGVMNLQGVKFPSTQNPSSNPNTLDDYEEGTWTPVVSGSSTAGTYELALAAGKYTKIGNAWNVTCRIKAAASVTGGGSGTLQIATLPFSYNGDLVNAEAYVNGVAFTGSYVSVVKTSSGTAASLVLVGVANTGTVTDVPIANFVANCVIEFSLTYLV
jgi:hypothetical protein